MLILLIDKILADDAYRHSSRSEILLGAGVDHSIFSEVLVDAANIRAHVTNHGHVGVHQLKWEVEVLDASNGLILGVVEISGILIPGPLRRVGHRRVVLFIRIEGGSDFSPFFCFLQRGLAPLANPHFNTYPVIR